MEHSATLRGERREGGPPLFFPKDDLLQLMANKRRREVKETDVVRVFDREWLRARVNGASGRVPESRG